MVPYNPYLSLRYGCHINVEACVNVDSIKYLYKYAYKGADRTTAMLHGTAVDSNAHPAARDEIREWLDSRYISACEAAWHLLGFSVHNEAPAVMRLSVHLPLRQTVTFQPEADLQHVSERAQHTTLTKWFAFNKAARQRYEADVATGTAPAIPECLNTLYADFPAIATWSDPTRTWHARKARFNTIGRMYFVPPSMGEPYYLRMLLNHVPGATSFSDLAHHHRPQQRAHRAQHLP